MAALGAGCPPAQGAGNELALPLLLMILSPGLFGGDNSLLLFILIIAMSSGGRLI
ncbi:MAG: hypothetical protein LBB94_11350 [Clostridiales bacterium]|nr:hypothetical protein [Clostridiales bacterium]